MIISQCCGAPLDPKFPNDEVCNQCKEHCSTTTDDEIRSKMTESREERAIEDGEQKRDQYADSE